MSIDIKKRWLLWLDMLGFKNWLERNVDNSKAIDRLEAALSYAFNLESGICSDFQSIQLSDTIIITTPGDSLEELCKLSTISSFLMAALLEVDLPIRGVVSHGNAICRLSSNRISLLGDSIVEAATLEPQLNFFGVAVAPSCVNHWITISDTLSPNLSIGGLEVKMADFMSIQTVPTKLEEVEMFVFTWALDCIPERLLELGMRILQNPGSFTIQDLKEYNQKLKRSIFMVDTVAGTDEEREYYRSMLFVLTQEMDELLDKIAKADTTNT